MELLPLVKLTLIVVTGAVVLFIIGSFVIYKFKEIVTGKKRPKTGPEAYVPQVKQTKTMHIPSAPKPKQSETQQQSHAVHNPPSSKRQPEPHYQQEGKPQQTYTHPPQSQNHQQHYPQEQRVKNDQRRYTSSRRTRMEFADQAPVQKVIPKRDIFQVVNSQQASARFNAPDAGRNERNQPFYIPQSVIDAQKSGRNNVEKARYSPDQSGLNKMSVNFK
ncbi:MAG: hypothetical protein IAE91_12825 [Ignavibacteriaceae bacterium]|nr:hypothetical protein [Ignavibacteriaceae bacterium]